MSDRVRVGEADELAPGERALVVAAGTSIGVFNVDGEYYALENECAHQHGPVCTGKIQRNLVAEATAPGEFDREYFGERPTIACPWHGWEYDVETGRHLGDGDHALRSFDVVEDDGVVYVVLD